MKKIATKKLQKGMGVIICIPGDEHKGVQSKRPGIVVKTHIDYITVQLFSSQPSDHDLATFTINNKKQYLRPIYLKNVTPNQIIGYWFDYSKREPVSINENSKLMQIIESNEYIASSITLKLNEYLDLKNNNINSNELLKLKNQVDELVDWIKDLQEENANLKQKLENKLNLKTKGKSNSR